MSLGAAASAEPALEALGRGDLKDVARLQALLDGGEDGKGGRIVSLTGSSQSRRSFLVSHAAAGRPVFYWTLREATSTHALLSTTVQQLYAPLGRLGDFCACVGLYWIMLQDLVAHDPAHVRAVNFSIVLSQLKRGLAALSGSTLSGGSKWEQGGWVLGGAAPLRPLLVVEQLHVPTDASACPGGDGLGPMCASLRQFLLSCALDLALADVVVTSAGGSPAAAAAEAAWKSGYGAGAAERSRLYYGATAVAFSQPEPAEAWVAALGRSGAGTA